MSLESRSVHGTVRRRQISKLKSSVWQRKEVLNMENISNKVAYLKGYADAVDLSKSGDEGKVINKLIDILDDMAKALEDVIDAHDELDAKVDEIDEDLADVEDALFDEDEEDEDDDEYDDDDEEYEYDDDDGYFEIECPSCHEDVLVDFDLLDEEHGIVCPNCHQEIELEFDCDCDDCGDNHHEG